MIDHGPTRPLLGSVTRGYSDPNTLTKVPRMVLATLKPHPKPPCSHHSSYPSNRKSKSVWLCTTTTCGHARPSGMRLIRLSSCPVHALTLHTASHVHHDDLRGRRAMPHAPKLHAPRRQRTRRRHS